MTRFIEDLKRGEKKSEEEAEEEAKDEKYFFRLHPGLETYMIVPREPSDSWWASAFILLLLFWTAPRLSAGSEPASSSISLAGFDEGIQHWRNRYGGDYPRYSSEQVDEIAENLLLYQRMGGGWAENQDPTRILSRAEKWELIAEKALPGGSFDNHNVYPQVEYLAWAYRRKADPSYRKAAGKGLEFILANQQAACGAWPHTVPASKNYHRHLTLADEVTTGNLALLRRVAAEEPPFELFGADLRRRAAEAVSRGDACLLRLQIHRNGVATGWAGQYDPKTLDPAGGRSFELPALASRETVEVLRYLMSIPSPEPEVIAAVDTGAAWLRTAALSGLRLETFPAETMRYEFHETSVDRRLVNDPNSPPLWARYYDLEDGSVILADYDGKRVEDYGRLSRERRTGYAWYGEWPRPLLESEYPAWKAKIRRSAATAR